MNGEFDNPAVLTTPSLPEFNPASVVPSFAAPPPMPEASLAGGLEKWSHFGEAWSTAYQASQLDGLSNSRGIALQNAISERNKAVKQATGQDLEDPTRDGYLGEAMQRWWDETGHQGRPPDMPGVTGYDMGLSTEENARIQQLQLDAYQDKLNQLGRDYLQPDLGGDIRSGSQALANKAVEDARTAAQTAGGPLGFAAGLTGGIAASWRDPLQLASLFLGGGEAKIARSVAGQMFESFLRHGAVNAAVTAASEPEIAAWRAERGQPMSWGDAAFDMGVSFLFGGGLGAVGHLITRAGSGDGAAARELLGRLRDDKAPQAAADLRPVLDAIQDDHAAAQGAPKELSGDPGQLQRDAARALEREDAPINGMTTAESADLRAEALPEATSHILGADEPPPSRQLDTVREIEPPPAPKAEAPGEAKPAAEPDLFPAHDLRAPEAHAEDPLNVTPIERNGRLEMLAPGEAGAPNERVGFMAQLIENCVL